MRKLVLQDTLWQQKHLCKEMFEKWNIISIIITTIHSEDLNIYQSTNSISEFTSVQNNHAH